MREQEQRNANKYRQRMNDRLIRASPADAACAADLREFLASIVAQRKSPSKYPKRNPDILRLRLSGWLMRDIAKEYGITQETVWLVLFNSDRMIRDALPHHEDALSL